MEYRAHGFLLSKLEDIVANPLRATLLVGSSILILMKLIEALAVMVPMASYLKYLVPFLPPYVITSVARRINLKKGRQNC